MVTLPDGDLSEYEDDDQYDSSDQWEPEINGENGESSDDEAQIPGPQAENSRDSTSSEETADDNEAPRISRKRPRKSDKYKWQSRTLEITGDISWKGKLPDPPDVSTPFDYFLSMFDENMYRMIADQSNMYALQKDGIILNTDGHEIRKFIGMLLHMGVVKMPSKRMYWEQRTRYAIIADAMSRNRFDRILQYFHLNDNAKMKAPTEDGYDKLFKVRPLLDSLRANALKIAPEEHQSIDEHIIPFKGRSSLKQYLRNKPHKWGYKVFTRASSSGIVHDFEIYQGKGTVTDGGGDMGISGQIVIRLSSGLEHLNHKLFFDNWFTSVELIEKLMQLGIHSFGTVRTNRLGNCPLKSEKEMKQSARGSHDIRLETNSNIVAVRWYDNKAVTLVSSYASVEPQDQVQRYNLKRKHHEEIPRPFIIKEYNKFMGGVDLSDMLLELYRIEMPVKRWYLHIVFYCIELAMSNAWLLYRRHLAQSGNSKYMCLREFRLDVAEALIMSKKRGRPNLANPLAPRNNPTAPIPVVDVRYDGSEHWPQHTETKKRCRFCKVGFTRTCCQKCGVGLCLNKNNNCFLEFHKK